MGRNLGIIDKDTGELVNSGGRWRFGYMENGAFVTVGRAEAGLLAHLRLTALEWRVLWYVLSCCEMDNWTPFVAKDIAVELGSTQPNVSLALKRLVETGLLLRDAKTEGRRYRYRLSPAHFYRGTGKQHHVALAQTGARPVAA